MIMMIMISWRKTGEPGEKPLWHKGTAFETNFTNHCRQLRKQMGHRVERLIVSEH